jgi:rare lipoprotein A (peptidoglycan hydrolase)
MKKLTIVSTVLLIAIIWYLNCYADSWIERTKSDAPQMLESSVAKNDAASFCPIARMERAKSVQISRSLERVHIGQAPKGVPIARLSRRSQIVSSPRKVQKTKFRKKVQLAKSHSRTRMAKSRRHGSHITGIASWYGGQFLGRKTASGARFVAHKMTAAHKHLPFGTKLLVKNHSNGRTAVVTVNDRGPFIKDRVLDLSPAAAQELGMISAGITPITATVVNDS